jgi:D-glycero-beta-D-manno-heptose 1-phosphate adenylyltransferase
MFVLQSRHILKCVDRDLTLCKSHEFIKHEVHPKVDYKNKVCVKPWGHEFLMFQNESIGMWFLRITGGNRTSVHCHYNKDTTIVVLRGSLRLELIDGEVMTINEMETVHIPHYKFHSIGSFSPETFIIEIEIYNKSVNFSDKNDLLRVTDIYKRRDNKYETSIDLSDELEKYGYFYLTKDLDFHFNDIEMKVSNKCDPESNHSIILDGLINTGNTVISPGTFIDSVDELHHLNDESLFLNIHNRGCRVNHKVIYTNEQLSTLIKSTDKKIVLTSGCFDIIHVGHVQNLIQAKNTGDILMVCLSSDKQIKKLKGETRPVNKYQDRVDLFKMIECVDYIILYDEVNNETEETLDEIMQLVNPHVWVKGSDYTVDQIRKKHPHLREIKLLENVPDISTTNIIRKILKNTEDSNV